MAKKTKPAPSPAPAPTGRDPGVTVRVPLVIVKQFREIAASLPRSPLLSDEDAVRALALRALELGAASPELVPRS